MKFFINLDKNLALPSFFTLHEDCGIEVRVLCLKPHAGLWKGGHNLCETGQLPIFRPHKDQNRSLYGGGGWGEGGKS